MASRLRAVHQRRVVMLAHASRAFSSMASSQPLEHLVARRLRYAESFFC
jgi:hypothetical protein